MTFIRCFFSAMFLLGAGRAAAEPEFATSCVIIDGEAIGYVHNRGHSFWIEGRALFHYFDADGDLLRTRRSTNRLHHHASSGRTEEVDDDNAPSGAAFCAFDLSECEISE